MSTNFADWLRRLGLEQYVPAFAANDIDAEVLPELTTEDLIGLGVASIGHRRKLLAAIAALRPTAPGAADPLPPPLAGEGGVGAQAERRQLTMMFCDLVGSTPLSVRSDPEDLREVIGAYHRCVADTVTRFAGFVAKYMGDGVLVYFGYPEAHEDDAERAVRAGLAVVDAVGKLTTPEPLNVRLGIASGLVVVGDLIGEGAAQERGVVGETPNLAARLQGLAPPGTLVVADSTRRQIGALFDLEDLGPQPLSGFAEPQHVWRVVGQSGVVSRFEALRSEAAPLVGRDEELDLLLRRWRQAKSGEGRVVLLSGEPGIGKSRLTAALSQAIRDEPHTRLRYFCSPYHQDSALYPFITQLERAAGFTHGDTVEEKLGKLRGLLAPGAPRDDEIQLLAELLSLPNSAAELNLSPQRKREMVFEALLHQLEALACVRPILMVFEDAHWVDPSSRELLDLTLERARRLPVLLVVTFRLEFQPPWIGLSHVSLLALNRLDPRGGSALVAQLAGNLSSLSADVVAEIVERTDGVPLFIEEVTKAVLEAAEGADAEKARGAATAIPRTRLAVPATLQASLLARLDRLGPAAKEAAQVGAAIGREFSYQLLIAAALGSKAALRDGLHHLVGAGLVFQRGVPPAAEYQFKHALVRDTAYGTLLRGPRQRLHQRIATALHDQSPEMAERAPEILAHHLAAAGQLDSAAAYWLEAGRRAAARSANIEAITHLTRGIEALRGVTDTAQRARLELALQLALGPAVMSTRGHNAPEAEIAYQEARRLSEQLGDDRAHFASVWGLWLTRGSRSKRSSRRELADELFKAAERLGDRGLLLEAHHAGWATDISGASYISGGEHVRRGLALYDPEQHRSHALIYGGHDPAVCGKGQRAMMLWLLGYPDKAVQEAREGIAFAGTLTHVPSVGHALWFAAMACQLRRDPPAVLDVAERLLAIGIEHGLGQYQAIGGIMHGWACVHLADREEGLSELRRAVICHGGTQRSYFNAILAETELGAGHLERALAALNSAAEISDELGETFWRAGILCVEGDLLRARAADDRRAPEDRYREAIAMARRQQAKSLELRAATRLARLWAEQGRRAEARELLAPVYGWFTEGFGTADLKDAEALLGQLA
jgi:class 3 adenylate cyclase/predicted ATPase